MGIDELFKMLDCKNDKKIQEKAIEEGRKVKYFEIFVRPIENQDIWENCAKIIITKLDEIVHTGGKYILFEWLQNKKWPGYHIIYNGIKTIPFELIHFTYIECVKEAKQLEDNEWLNNLAQLIREKNIYNQLNDDEKEILKEYI